MRRIEQSGIGRRDHAIRAARQHRRGSARHGADDGQRVLDGADLDGRRLARRGRDGQFDVVDEWVRAHCAVGWDRAGAELGGPGESTNQIEPIGHDARPGCLVSLVFEIVSGQELTDAHEAEHRGVAVGIEAGRLEGEVDGVHQIRRCGRSPRDEFPCREVPGGQTWSDRVDRRAPSVVGELDPGDFEDPCRRIAAVEVRRGVGPVGRHVLGPLEEGVNEVAGEQR